MDGYVPSALTAAVAAREKLEHIMGPLMAASEMCTEAQGLLRTVGTVAMTETAASAVDQIDTELVQAANSCRIGVDACNRLIGYLQAGPASG